MRKSGDPLATGIGTLRMSTFSKLDLEHIHTTQTFLALLPLCRRPDHTLVVLLAPSETSQHGFTLEAVNRMIHETSNREGGGGEKRR